jgi:hypothetical protein
MAAAQTAASANKEAAPKEEKKPQAFGDFAPPQTMERVDQPSVDGWYKPETGNGFYGKILSSFQVKDKKSGMMRDVVVVGLLVDCQAIDAESKKPVTLKRGQYLGVSVRHKLQPIMEYVTHKGTVYAKAIEQVSIGGGQTMWNFDLRCEGTKAAPPAPRQLAHDSAAKGGAGGSDDDIPF